MKKYRNGHVCPEQQSGGVSGMLCGKKVSARMKGKVFKMGGRAGDVEVPTESI